MILKANLTFNLPYLARLLGVEPRTSWSATTSKQARQWPSVCWPPGTTKCTAS